MLAKLYIHYKQPLEKETSNFTEKVLNANQYLRIYS